MSTAAKRLFLSQPAVSGALNRLRDFFKDDLLVPVGRQMMLTPKAEELRAPVLEALMLIRAKITTPGGFDPLTATRHFTIIASDYVYSVLLTEVFARTAVLAPGLTFDVLSTGKRRTEKMERGEADILITIPQFHTDEHPRVALFENEHATVAWREGRHGTSMTRDDFYEEQHAVVLFGRDPPCPARSDDPRQIPRSGCASRRCHRPCGSDPTAWTHAGSSRRMTAACWSA